MSTEDTAKTHAAIKANIENNYAQIKQLFDMQVSELPNQNGFNHIYEHLNAKAIEQDGTLDINYHAEYLVHTIRLMDHFLAEGGLDTLTQRYEYDREVATKILLPMLGEHASAFNKLSDEDKQHYITSVTTEMPIDWQLGSLVIEIEHQLKNKPEDPMIFVDPRTGKTYGVETKTPETQAITIKDATPPPILHDGKDLGI